MAYKFYDSVEKIMRHSQKNEEPNAGNRLQSGALTDKSEAKACLDLKRGYSSSAAFRGSLNVSPSSRTRQLVLGRQEQK